MSTDTSAPGNDLRQLAITRLRKKRELHTHLVVYLAVNLFLFAIWAFSGVGFFWPAFPLLGWGIGMMFHAWDVYSPEQPTEAKIDREIKRLTSR